MGGGEEGTAQVLAVRSTTCLFGGDGWVGGWVIGFGEWVGWVG